MKNTFNFFCAAVVVAAATAAAVVWKMFNSTSRQISDKQLMELENVRKRSPRISLEMLITFLLVMIEICMNFCMFLK